jgi:hypothetical protein
MPIRLLTVDPMLRLSGKTFDDDYQAKKRKHHDMN